MLLNVSNPKLEKLVRQLIGGSKYLYLEFVCGIWASMIGHYGVEETEENLQVLKETIEDEYWGGVEPEWASLEAEKWWNNLNLSYFKKREDYNGHIRIEWAVPLIKPLLIN